MVRRNRDPEREAKREKMSSLLQELKVSSIDDIHDLFKEMIGTFLENGLEGELDEELGYSKYDYKNKMTYNSRNGTSQKKVKFSFGEIDIEVPRGRKGEFDPGLVKKQQTSISGRVLYPGNYAVVLMDAIHFHVRSQVQIVKKAVYIGINMGDMRGVLGIQVGKNESAKSWF
jgi:transposase-like protein